MKIKSFILAVVALVLLDAGLGFFTVAHLLHHEPPIDSPLPLPGGYTYVEPDAMSSVTKFVSGEPTNWGFPVESNSKMDAVKNVCLKTLASEVSAFPGYKYKTLSGEIRYLQEPDTLRFDLSGYGLINSQGEEVPQFNPQSGSDYVVGDIYVFEFAYSPETKTCKLTKKDDEEHMLLPKSVTESTQAYAESIPDFASKKAQANNFYPYDFKWYKAEDKSAVITFSYGERSTTWDFPDRAKAGLYYLQAELNMRTKVLTSELKKESVGRGI